VWLSQECKRVVNPEGCSERVGAQRICFGRDVERVLLYTHSQKVTMRRRREEDIMDSTLMSGIW
jgi:hypothetical protein